MHKNKRKFAPFHTVIARRGRGLVRDIASLIPDLTCVWM